MRKIFSLALLCLILGGYLLTLKTHPPGLLNDETDIGYEAYSILQTGRDQWGNFLPITYFSGFGGTRLPLIVYWTVPFIKILGLNPEAVRLGGVFAALLAIIGFYLLTKRIFATLILAFTPWFWGLSRTTNEAVLALAFTLLGVFFLHRGKSKPRLWLISAIFFGLSAYSYYSSQVFIPLFLFLFFLGRGQLLRKNRKTIVVAVLLLFLIISPLTLSTIYRGGSATRLNQTSLLGNISLVGQLNERRGDCLEFAPKIWCQSAYNRPAMWLGEIVNNYFDHFSLNFLFRDNWFVGILPSGRLFYLILLPGIIAGFYYLAKRKIPNGWLWFCWLAAAPVADSLTGNGHAMRALLMVPPLVFFAIAGWELLISRVQQVPIKKILIISVAGIFFFETGYFLSSYWRNFPKRNSAYTHYPYQPLMKYLLEIEDQYPAIYLSNNYQSIKQYSFYLFYSRYDPATFQQATTAVWEKEDGGWIWVKQIGKWHFVKEIPPLETIPEGSLVIGNKDEVKNILLLQARHVPGEQISKFSVLQTIKYLNNDPAFVIGKVIKGFSGLQPENSI